MRPQPQQKMGRGFGRALPRSARIRLMVCPQLGKLGRSLRSGGLVPLRWLPQRCTGEDKVAGEEEDGEAKEEEDMYIDEDGTVRR